MSRLHLHFEPKLLPEFGTRRLAGDRDHRVPVADRAKELGEAVIALVYLVPIIWSGYRWGQGPGMSAALAAALAFDFLFIPPFYTFVIGSLEGWLVLAIFLAVAMLLVGRFHASLADGP